MRIIPAFLSPEMLVHRCGLVRAHDARGDVRVPFRFDRASPRLENYPQATTPHTTPSLDYLIVASSILFQPFTAHALDLAGTEPIKSRAAVWVAFTLSIFRFCVIGTSGLAKRNGIRTPSGAAQRIGAIARSGDHFAIVTGASACRAVVFCPAIAYWSGQPGLAGNSHESLKEIAEHQNSSPS